MGGGSVLHRAAAPMIQRGNWQRDGPALSAPPQRWDPSPHPVPPLGAVIWSGVWHSAASCLQEPTSKPAVSRRGSITNAVVLVGLHPRRGPIRLCIASIVVPGVLAFVNNRAPRFPARTQGGRDDTSTLDHSADSKHAFCHGLTAAIAMHRARREQLGCDAVFWRM